MRKALAVLFVLCFTANLFAQVEEGTTEPKEQKVKIPTFRMNIKGDFKLPTPTFNKAFAKTVGGIADASLSFNFPLTQKIHIGAGFRYTYFQINDLILNSNTNANIQVYSPFIRIGFEKYANAKLIYGFGVRTGYSFLNFFSSTFDNNDSLNCTPRQMGLILEPEFTIGLMAGENVAFSLQLSYNIIFAEYTSSNVCLPNFSGLAASDSKGKYQFFCAGFGFTAFLGDSQKKKGSAYKGYGL